MLNQLREIRTRQSKAQIEVAIASGCSTTTISNIEAHGYEPNNDTKAKIAAALGVTVSDVWPECDQKVEVV